MNENVIAIGLDAPNLKQFENWVESGHLPYIEKFFCSGVFNRYSYKKQFRNERCWGPFLSGKNDEHINNYGSVFEPGSYQYANLSAYMVGSYPPFYDIGEKYRICTFDLQAPLLKSLKGLQIAGWASELNQYTPQSEPPELIQQIISQHGIDPKMDISFQVYDQYNQSTGLSYTIPSLYDVEQLQVLKNCLITSIARRTAICLDLIKRERWDLFMAVFSETHTANHILWHQQEKHPASHNEAGKAVLLEIYQAFDSALGKISSKLPADAHQVFFSIDNTTFNSMDIPSMLFLPELLFRWNFPGQAALAVGNQDAEQHAAKPSYKQHWKHEVWSLRTPVGEQRLQSPSQQTENQDPFSWNPANWYKPVWQQMRAFALPSVSDGYIRLNVQGRESAGVLPATEFAACMDELSQLLLQARDANTGQALVKELIQLRQSPFDRDAECPADLLVCWNDEIISDTLEHPQLGRIGPVPFFRSGGHYPHGTMTENFFAISGPQITPQTRLSKGKLHDLPATILDLMNAPIPRYFDGKSLLQFSN